MKVSEIMRKDYLYFDSSESLAVAAKKLSEKNQSEAPVVSKGKFIGLLLSSDIAAALVKTTIFGKPKTADVRKVSGNPVEKHLSSHRTWLSEDADILSALLLLIHRNVDCIPVIGKDRKLIGVVLASDIRKEMSKILNSTARLPARKEAAAGAEPEWQGENTAIDQIVQYVQKKGAATADEIAKNCRLKVSEVEEYAGSLEKNGLIKVEYNIIGKMKLRKPE